MRILTKNFLLSLSTSALMLSISACSNGGDSKTLPTGTAATTVTPVDKGVQGLASVSGSIATASSGISASSALRAPQANTEEDAGNALLAVDLDANGIYGDTNDFVISSKIEADGSFGFNAIKVNEQGDTKAQLTVSKPGFSPVVKVITLVNGQSVSVLADAASTPLLVETVNISKLRANGTLSSSFLKIGSRRTESGLSSYSQIMSLSEMKANSDVPISGDVETETVIPLGALPDTVTSIKAETQSFDPTNEEDAKKFPGEYKGVGEPGKGEQRLVSVGFDYMSLTDQNGDQIELNNSKLQSASKLLPQAIDFTSCLRTSTRHLNKSQLALFKKYGDDDNTTAAFEVPLWYYNYKAGNWSYLGKAEVYGSDGTTNFSVDSTETYGYAKMCITENWGTSVNLDYSITPKEPTNVCVVAKDQNDKNITGLYVEAQQDTSRNGHYIDAQGKTKLALLAGNDISKYKFTYTGAITGWNTTTVQDADIVSGGEAGCDNTLNINVVNPYSATLKVTVKELDGTPAVNKYVTAYNSQYNNYQYTSAYTDKNGLATFKIKPSQDYIVKYKSTTVAVNINGAVTTPENADNGRIATVTVQEIEKVPTVNVYLYNNSISNTAESVNFYVSVSDENEDPITLKSLKLNGAILQEGSDYTIKSNYAIAGYSYFTAKLDLASATVSAITPNSLAKGAYTLEAIYSDGKGEGKGASKFTVNENRAPVVSSVYFYKTSTNRYTYINSNIEAGDYLIKAYAYDPDADALNYSYILDGKSITSESVTLADGAHTLTIKVNDGTLSGEKTFNFYVGNHAPEITAFGASSYSIDLNSQNTSINIYAYVKDQDGDKVTVQTTDGNVTLKSPYGGSYYFKSDSLEITKDTTFKIYVNDGELNSSVQTINIATYRANQAPIFDKELKNAQVASGDTKEFTCSAIDPEGDTVSYAWYINKELQSQTGITFSTTLTQTSTVTCVATDADPLEPASATSSASVIVYDPNASGYLTVNTLPGSIVATHDTKTLKPLVEKIAGDDGQAVFEITGTDRVTFSITLTPDIEINKEVIFQTTLSQINGELKRNCNTSSSANAPQRVSANTTDYTQLCKSYDSETFMDSKAFPNDYIVLLGDYNASTFDTDKSGTLNSSELNVLAVQMYDDNKDGKVTWKEYSNSYDNQYTTRSEYFVNVPVNEYTIALSAYYYGEGKRYPSESRTSAQANIKMSALPASKSLHVTNGYGDDPVFTVNKDGNLSIDNFYMYSSSDNYAYLMSYIDDNNATKYLLSLDNTTNDLNKSYTGEDFTQLGKKVTFNIPDYTRLILSVNYKGSELVDIYASGSLETDIVDNKLLEYTLNGDYNDYMDERLYINKSHHNYYTTKSLLSTYNGQDYPVLNITAQEDKAGSILFAGTDLSKINYTSVSFDIGGEVPELSVRLNYTVAPTTVNMPDFNTTLPTKARGNIPSADSYTSETVNMQEYKDLTEAQLIEKIVTQNPSLYAIGTRDLYLSRSYSNGIAPKSTLTKQVKYTKPFSIGYEPKSFSH